MYRDTYIKIDTDKLKNNITHIIKEYTGYKWYFGVVKGNAYGHGFSCVKYMEEAGINYFAVSSLDEAVKVRRLTKLPILCLQPIDIKYIEECMKNNITITINTQEYVCELLEKLNNISGILKVHIKINSGMNRLGFNDKEILKDSMIKLQNCSKIYLEGVYTHFATTGIYDKFWDEQLSKFEEITQDIDLSKIDIVHLAKSATLVNHKQIAYANGVRLGIIMYGYTNDIRKKRTGFLGRIKDIRLELKVKKMRLSKTSQECKAKVTPVISLISHVIQVNKIKKGDTVGYGAIYKAKDDREYIAVAEIGYADGLLLSNSNGKCEINDSTFEIVGSINMGMITIKVDDKVKKGDEVYIIDEKITAKELARRTHTTTYFTITNLSSNLPRIYVKGKEVVQIDE